MEIVLTVSTYEQPFEQHGEENYLPRFNLFKRQDLKSVSNYVVYDFKNVCSAFFILSLLLYIGDNAVGEISGFFTEMASCFQNQQQ